MDVKTWFQILAWPWFFFNLTHGCVKIYHFPPWNRNSAPRVLCGYAILHTYEFQIYTLMHSNNHAVWQKRGNLDENVWSYISATEENRFWNQECFSYNHFTGLLRFIFSHCFIFQWCCQSSPPNYSHFTCCLCWTKLYIYMVNSLPEHRYIAFGNPPAGSLPTQIPSFLPILMWSSVNFENWWTTDKALVTSCGQLVNKFLSSSYCWIVRTSFPQFISGSSMPEIPEFYQIWMANNSTSKMNKQQR